MKTLSTILAALAITVSLPALAAGKESYHSETKMERDKDGDYKSKRTVESTDSEGTNYSDEITSDTDVDSNGKHKTTIKSKSVKDPKGLGNKEKVTTKRTREEKDNGEVESTYEKKVNGDTVEKDKSTR